MRVYKEMRPLGVALWFTGCARVHKDGDCFAVIFRAWHPVTWLLLVVMLIPCALQGEQLLYVVPLKLSIFWKQNLDQLQWVTPFTRLETLEPFKFRASTVKVHDEPYPVVD